MGNISCPSILILRPSILIVELETSPYERHKHRLPYNFDHYPEGETHELENILLSFEIEPCNYHFILQHARYAMKSSTNSEQHHSLYRVFSSLDLSSNHLLQSSI